MARGVITVGNDLILGQGQPLTATESKIIRWVISKIKRTDDTITPIVVHLSELADAIGVSPKHCYKQLKKSTRQLTQKGGELHTGKKLLQFSWLSTCEYNDGTGIVELELSPKLHSQLIGLDGFFTSYALKNILRFRNRATIPLYEYLKYTEHRGGGDISLDQLRKILGLQGRYARWERFRTSVLEPALAEIDELKEISVSWSPVKTGRAISGVKFTVRGRKTKRATPGQCAQDQGPDRIETAKRLVVDAVEKANQSGIDIFRQPMVRSAIIHGLNWIGASEKTVLAVARAYEQSPERYLKTLDTILYLHRKSPKRAIGPYIIGALKRAAREAA